VVPQTPELAIAFLIGFICGAAIVGGTALAFWGTGKK